MLKKLPLLICLMSALNLTALKAQSTMPKTDSPVALVDESATYSGQTVQAIIDAIIAEANAEIETAFAEGYKQGVLEYAPETERLSVISKSLWLELEKERRRAVIPVWQSALWTAGGALVGSGIGYLFGRFQ
jgi:hypothetical protein